MAYKYDKELAPVFKTRSALDKEKEKPKSWLGGKLSQIFNRRNAFVLMQLMATVSLAVSGHLAGNDGRMFTGIGNSTKNTGWAIFKNFGIAKNKNPLEKDIIDTRANIFGSGLSALTNVPQLAMNLTPVFMGAAAGAAWGDIIGAGMGVAAYGLMFADQKVKSKRLKKLKAIGDRKYPENPEIWDLYDIRRRTVMLGYKERGHNVKEVLFNKLPSLLLAGRGLMFAATGLMATAQGGGWASYLMAAAGMMFTYGAFKEYRYQNHRDYKDIADLLESPTTTLEVEEAKKQEEIKEEKKKQEKELKEQEKKAKAGKPKSEDGEKRTEDKASDQKSKEQSEAEDAGAVQDEQQDPEQTNTVSKQGPKPPSL